MLRTGFISAGILLLVPAMIAHAEPKSPAQDSAAQSVRTLTIRGKAISQEGKPVAGAKVHLVASNRTYTRETIAEATTNDAGEYAFRDVSLPLQIYRSFQKRDEKLTEGAFQVFGLAEGYGLTWTTRLRFSVEPRPQENSQKDLIYAGEEGRADLAFDLPAWLSGRITNEQGQPLAGVRVQVGHCDDLRRPGGFGVSSCTYLGPQGDEAQAEAGRFDGIRHIPEKHRLAVTDERGRYQFTQLRRDSQYLVLLDAGPECDPVMFTGLTSTKELPGRRTLGYESEFNETFKTPWQFVVKVVSSDGQPQANVKIRARCERMLRAGGVATTNVTGQAVLKLLADKYTLFLEPPYGSPYLLTEREVTVSPESAGGVNSLILNPAATLLIKSVEEGTGKPVAGVSFVEEIDSGKRRQELRSQTVFVDHPVTDEHGELRVVVTPGERRILVAKQPAGFEPIHRFSELLNLAANSSETVTFTFKKVAAAPPAMNLVPEDEGELGKLNALILRQKELTKAGRFELKSHVRSAIGLSGEDLRSVLAASNPQEIPDLAALLRQKNPTLEIPFGNMVVVVDGNKSRNEIETLIPQFEMKSRHITAFNGMETVSYSSDSPQADIYSIEGGGGFRIGLTESRMLTAWQPIPKIQGAAGEPIPERKIIREGGRIVVDLAYKKYSHRQVFDEKSGFLFHQASLQNGGESGRERWQFAPRLAPNGGIVAGLSVEANYYKEGRVGLLRIHEVTSFTLGPQPPDSFAVSVPAGTLLLDHRGSQRSPKTEMVLASITDVISQANQIAENDRVILNVLKDGDPAPAIEPAAWLNADGPTEKLDWKGKVLLIDFWGTGCGPCIAELPVVQAFAVKFQKAGGVVLGLHDSGAEPAAVTEFVRKRGLAYQFAIDKPSPDAPSFGAIFQAFGIRGIPNCAVIDRKGNVIYLGRFEEAARRATKLLEMEAK